MRLLACLSDPHSLILFFTVTILCEKASPTKPTCDPREPCKVGFLGLEFCSCPNGQKCPKSHQTSMIYENIKYNFCEPPTIHTCIEGELAWVRRGLRQTIYCKCPAPLSLTSRVWDDETDNTHYKCTRQRQCRGADDVCMVRNRIWVGTKMVSLLKGLCQCPESQRCKETGQSVKNSDTTQLRQDLFKCAPLDTGDWMEEYGDEDEYGTANRN